MRGPRRASKPRAAKKISLKISELNLENVAEASTADPGLREGQSSRSSPVYFWRETHPITGYLSQWYQCPFKGDDGKTYKTAEHYMMHHKALLFNDDAMAAKILEAGHPREVKTMGRNVSGFDEKVWNQNRERIVRRASYFKFATPLSDDGLRRGTCADSPLVGTTLRALLLSTGPAELVEASPFDRVWGVGFRSENAAENRERWGLNLLGKALMEVRETFRKEDEENEEEAAEEEGSQSVSA